MVAITAIRSIGSRDKEVGGDADKSSYSLLCNSIVSKSKYLSFNHYRLWLNLKKET